MLLLVFQLIRISKQIDSLELVYKILTYCTWENITSTQVALAPWEVHPHNKSHTHLVEPSLFLESTVTASGGGSKQIHRKANWWKRAFRGQRFSLGVTVAIISMSYKIQPDPINMPPDRRASHQPNLENQLGANESENEALYGCKQTKTTQYKLEETDASNDINLLRNPHLT